MRTMRTPEQIRESVKGREATEEEVRLFLFGLSLFAGRADEVGLLAMAAETLYYTWPKDEAVGVYSWRTR